MQSLSPLTPTPTHFCDAAVVTDWANPDNSQYFYTLAGSDRACGGSDDIVKMVRLGTPVTDAPVTVAMRRVRELLVPVSGAIGGWLAIDALARLVKTDPAFASPTVILSGVSFAIPVGRNADELFLAILSGGNVAVQRFNLAAGTFDSTPLFTLPGGLNAAVLSSVQDEVQIYIATTDFSAGRMDSVWRLPLAATAAGSGVQMTAEGSGPLIGGPLSTTTEKVVYVVRNNNADSLVAVDKTASGTTPGAALVPAPPAATTLTLMATAGDKVFYETADGTGRAAFAITETGSEVVTETAAAWAGFAHPTTRSLVTGSIPVTGILASGLSSGGSYGGASLATIVLSTGASGVTLGGDVLFADTATATSLVRVTSTATISEVLPTGK